ncbi:MAG: M28 family metallopeptidase, partial [Candidatus Eisenbacteria bacterium]
SDSVDTLLIKSTLFDLTYDVDLGDYRSRYACRIDLNRDIAPYIEDRLNTYVTPHGGSVVIHDCVDADSSCGAVPFRNIAGVIPGKRTSAHYLMCAHYDAIGVREPGWNWRTDPAPGADDNASGVVAVLECARLLAGLDLDFGLTFVAFSGEELGLLGSDCYVDALSEEDSILGVINFDMVGYAESGNRTEITYDWRSAWLSALIDETGDTLGIDSVYTFNRSGVANSDHSSFWQAGIPGVMLADRTGRLGSVAYPYYHMVGDTLGNLSMDQIADNVALVTGLLARFAVIPEDSLNDLLLTEAGIEWDWEGQGINQPLVAGQPVTATVRAVNIGASMREAASYNFEVWQGEPERGRLVQRSTPLLELVSGQPTDLSVSLDTDPETRGTVLYSFRLLPVSGDIESDLSNNLATSAIEVMSPTGVLDNLHVFPNPITTGSAPMLAFDVFHPDGDNFKGTMEIWIFDLEGRQIGHGSLENSYVGSLEMVTGEGRNWKPLGRFLTSGSDLPPGLYLCIAELSFLDEERRTTARSKFAVAR